MNEKIGNYFVLVLVISKYVVFSYFYFHFVVKYSKLIYWLFLYYLNYCTGASCITYVYLYITILLYHYITIDLYFYNNILSLIQ